jgi:hypothetical protein
MSLHSENEQNSLSGFNRLQNSFACLQGLPSQESLAIDAFLACDVFGKM